MPEKQEKINILCNFCLVRLSKFKLGKKMQNEIEICFAKKPSTFLKARDSFIVPLRAMRVGREQILFLFFKKIISLQYKFAVKKCSSSQ